MDRGQVRVLTDTHALVWALSKPDSLSTTALKALTESEVSASIASLWELVLKMQKPAALHGAAISRTKIGVVQAAMIKVDGLRAVFTDTQNLLLSEWPSSLRQC